MVFPCFLTKSNDELLILGGSLTQSRWTQDNCPWIHSDRPVLLLLCHGGLLCVVDSDRWGSQMVADGGLGGLGRGDRCATTWTRGRAERGHKGRWMSWGMELKGPPEVIARGSSLDIIRLHTDWSENECILYPQFQWMSHCPHNTSLFFAPVSDTPIDHCGCNRFTIIICAIVFVDLL